MKVEHKTIFLIDMNSYFATMLQQENPKLRRKPVAVVKDVGRTCIIAASKEAKKMGIKTGSSLVEAQRLFPDLQVVGAEFGMFLSATKRLKQLFESVSPDVDLYSLDEAFVDISTCRQHLYPDPLKLAKQLQQAVKDSLGEWVTCNVGISYNRFLAKTAAEVAPKGSILEITPRNKDAVLATVGFEDVCGIGMRLSKKLKKLGITTPYMIRFYSEAELELFFGPFWSKELLRIAYGEESHCLRLLDKTQSHMKMVSRSITGWELCDSEDTVRSVLYNLISEVIYKLRKMKLAGRYVFVSLSNSGQYWRAHRTLKYYISHTQEMFDLIYHQLYQSWQRSFKVIKFRVGLGSLRPLSQTSLSLLPSWHRQEAIEEAKMRISDKYGLFTIKPGILVNKSIIKPEVTGFLGDKQYQLAS